MKDIACRRGRKVVEKWVAQGEHSQQDFKYTISDARKIARSVSAFANAEGGRLLIGVKDNGVVAGVRNEEDIYVVEQAAQRYCSPAVEVSFTAYSYDTNVMVICADIPAVEQRPVEVLEADGTRRAYYRVADENIVAHPLMVRAWQCDEPLSLTADSAVPRLLQLVEQHPDGLDPRQVPIALHISTPRAERLIVQLAAAGLLTFAHRRQGFQLTLPTPQAL